MPVECAGDYTIKELMACFLSHDLEDGEELPVGAGLPVPRAAVLLAHFTHAPNMKIKLGYSTTNLLNVSELVPIEFLADYRGTNWAEGYFTVVDNVTWQKAHKKTRFFIGGLQIDKYGNSNLIGIGDDIRKLRVRGPGGIGTCGMSANVKLYYLIANSHTKRVFVEKCDFVSAVGWGEGGADARKKLGLIGGGPKWAITPLCIMDFEEETKRMRLKSVHPGVTINQVIDNTGFELIIPNDVPATEPPSKEELHILRTRIDVEGVLRM